MCSGWMLTIKKFVAYILKALGLNFVKNRTENAMKEYSANTLNNKDTSFAVLAVRCNSENSVGKRKMTPG